MRIGVFPSAGCMVAIGLLSAALAWGEASPVLLVNPDFEKGDTGWNFAGDSSMSVLSGEAAHSGNQGLRVSDDSDKAGSSVASERFAVIPGTTYRLTFWGRTVSGGGLGVYVRYYDPSQAKPVSAEHADLSSKQSAWKQFTLDTVAPPNATVAEIWIHSYGPGRVVADLDDFTFEPATTAAQPPWPPSYKLSPNDVSRLTAADVVGPDGLVYPSWRLTGVPGGIPQIAAVVGPDFFKGLENQDISARLREAIKQAVAKGGGAVELPAGSFFLDRTLVIRDSGIVLRGAGRDQTKLTFRDHIPYGTVRFFDWSEEGEKIGPGGVMEIQANPKNLATLRLEAGGKKIKEALRSVEGKGWGNRFALRFTGAELLEQLGPGRHDLVAIATYENGDHFSQPLSLQVAPDLTTQISPDQHGAIVLVGSGKLGREVLLAKDGLRGDLKLQLPSGHGFQPGDRLVLDAPITERWNKLVGNVAKASHFRLCQYQVVAVGENWITLNQPLRIEFPVIDGSFVQKTGFIERSGIEDLTIVQQPIPADPAEKKPESLKYWYPVEDLWTDGATASYAWGCWFRGVRVLTAGRNPLYLTRSKFCEIRDCEADDSLFKGGGGTGYVGLERSFDCLMDSVVTRNMRHAPDLQWGSSGNVIRNGHFQGSDAQWHAGWTNENLLEGNLITSDERDMANNNGYGYGLFSTGPGDPLHGPEGPRNVVYHNDVASPKDGLHMNGGNEAWIVAYNRFRITEGLAVYGKEKSFDHIIRDNTFIIGKTAALAVQFDSPDCVGVELYNNSFYGPVGRIAGFLNCLGEFARDENNRVFPYDASAPLPKPPVESIFEWQRANPAKLTRLP